MGRSKHVKRLAITGFSAVAISMLMGGVASAHDMSTHEGDTSHGDYKYQAYQYPDPKEHTDYTVTEPKHEEEKKDYKTDTSYKPTYQKDDHKDSYKQPDTYAPKHEEPEKKPVYSHDTQPKHEYEHDSDYADKKHEYKSDNTDYKKDYKSDDYHDKSYDSYKTSHYKSDDREKKGHAYAYGHVLADYKEHKKDHKDYKKDYKESHKYAYKHDDDCKYDSHDNKHDYKDAYKDYDYKNKEDDKKYSYDYDKYDRKYDHYKPVKSMYKVYKPGAHYAYFHIKYNSGHHFVYYKAKPASYHYASSHQHGLYQKFDDTLHEHAALGVAALRADHLNKPNAEHLSKLVDKNSVEIAKVVEQGYHGTFDKFLPLWQSHIGYYNDYLKAAEHHDYDGKKEAKEGLQHFSYQVSNLLANKSHDLDKNKLQHALAKHGRQVTSILDDLVAGKYERAEVKARHAYEHMSVLAKILAEGAHSSKYIPARYS